MQIELNKCECEILRNSIEYCENVLGLEINSCIKHANFEEIEKEDSNQNLFYKYFFSFELESLKIRYILLNIIDAYLVDEEVILTINEKEKSIKSLKQKIRKIGK